MQISKEDINFTIAVLALLLAMGLGLTAIYLVAAFLFGLFAKRAGR